MPRVEVKLFGEFECRFNGEVVRFSTTSVEELLALLVLARGKALTRISLAERLWPEADHSRGLGNLRTTLHRLRSALPEECLIVSAEDVAIVTDEMDSDVQTIVDLRRKSRVAVSDETRKDYLSQTYSIIRRPFLEGWEKEWVEDYRGGYFNLAMETILGYADVCEAIGDFAGALAILDEASELFPGQAELIERLLRLAYQVKGQADALARSDIALVALEKNYPGQPPASIRKLVRSFKSSSYEFVPLSELFTVNESTLLARMVESNLKTNSKEALLLLSQEAPKMQIGQHIDVAYELLIMALETTEGVSEERLKVAEVSIPFASMLADYEGCHRWGEFVLQNTPEIDVRRASVLNWMGFASFEQRNYERALELVTASQRIYQELGNSFGVMRSNVALGGINWHLREYESSLELYNKALAMLPMLDAPTSKRFEGTVYSNLCALYLHTGDLEKSVDFGEKFYILSEDYPINRVAMAANLGLALVLRGRAAEGLALITVSLEGSARNKMTRFLQIALDLAGYALQSLNYADEAAYVLSMTAYHRKAISHTRSLAEEELFARHIPGGLVEVKGDKPVPTLNSLTEWTVEKLRAAV